MTGPEIYQNEMKLNEGKVEAMLKLKPPTNTEYLESILGAIQFCANVLPNNRKNWVDSEDYWNKLNHGSRK